MIRQFIAVVLIAAAALLLGLGVVILLVPGGELLLFGFFTYIVYRYLADEVGRKKPSA